MLFHASENDNNKNDTKEVHMNRPQRQSFMIKVLNKKETQNVRMDYQKSSAKTYAFE